MKKQTVEYFDDKDKLNGQLIYDEKQTGKQPTIIVFPAFEGLGEFAINYGQRLAENGFTVFVADMYGHGETADTIDGCMKLITPFLEDRNLVRRRAVLAFDAATKLTPVDPNNVGAIGFCFGGMCVLELARSGIALKAAVTAHGVLPKSNLPTEKMQGKFLILHGYKDPQAPPESLAGFAKEMEDAGVNDWTFIFFGNAMHSFTDPKTGTFDPEQEKTMGRVYNKTAANRSFHYALDFFKEILT